MAQWWRDGGSLARSIFSGEVVYALAPTRWASYGLSCSSTRSLRTNIGALQALLDAAAIGEGRGWARTIDGKDLSQLSWGLKKRPVEMKEPQSDSIEPQALTIQS
jgi:hypothetical protein